MSKRLWCHSSLNWLSRQLYRVINYATQSCSIGLVRLAVWAYKIVRSIRASLVCPLLTLSALYPLFTRSAASERLATYEEWPFLVFTARIACTMCRFAFSSFAPRGCNWSVLGWRLACCFLWLVVEVEGCASELLMGANIFAAALAALVEATIHYWFICYSLHVPNDDHNSKWASSPLAYFTGGSLRGKTPMVRGKTLTMGVLPHIEGGRFTPQATISLNILQCCYPAISFIPQDIIKNVVTRAFCLPMALSDRT